ncbi:uncharacterized protein LOC111704703 isoform X2 [Eurytemora carolleeae]|uniref:uncharacterized protein LOC111704703 isoform X2 n=1 Tax=Eurytemora carolleeae TaxID=1294199 RepID=UPI000C7702BD|nr:uncharacterized protein LOC111704703 isoform X2 [Eurytemora carolleeae]|eukprot:XP_023332792.1 uncharacterized protein LOC111704703 isoform X2 [Eurytemora affinis]
MESTFHCKKIGVIFEPPAIVILYRDKEVCKKRTMPIRLIQEHMKGNSKEQGLENIRKEFELNPGEDLNKLSDKELRRRKEIMDLSFEKNNIKKGDPGFVYDKKVEFKGVKEAADWDSGSDIEDKNPISERDPENIVSMDPGGKDMESKILENLSGGFSNAGSNVGGLEDLKPKVRGLEDLGPRFPGSSNLGLDSGPSSDSSTPVNSPKRNLQTLVSANKKMFGLDSPERSEEENKPVPAAAAVDPIAAPRSMSAGEDEDAEEDDFW